MTTPDSAYFLELQTRTGWGQMLRRFRDWIQPQPGWLTLDLGCGPGLLPALLAQAGCRAFGLDVDRKMFQPAPLHPLVIIAEIMQPPFPERTFDLITASNLLFFLPDPQAALFEITRLLPPGGQIAVLNPSEDLSVEAATALAMANHLYGLARESLLTWAMRAETHFRWTVAQTRQLFTSVGLELVETRTTMGPGFARFARGVMVNAR